MQDEQMVPAPVQAVWDALNDPAVLRECIPGCDQMEKVSDTEFRLGMLAVVGPVKARFTGKLLLADIVAPQRYSLNFEGAGGAAGFGKGHASVELFEEGPTQTRLKYVASAQVGGKLAQVGSRLIDGIAKKIASDFFMKFGKLLTPATPSAETVSSELTALPMAMESIAAIEMPTPAATAAAKVAQTGHGATGSEVHTSNTMLKPALLLSILVLVGLISWYFAAR